MLQHQMPLRPRYGWRGVAVVLLLALLGALVAMYWVREQRLHERHSTRAQLLALMAQALDGQAAQAGLREQLKSWGQPTCRQLEQMQPAPSAVQNVALSTQLAKVRDALSAEAVYVLNAQGQVLLQQAQGTRTRLSAASQALRQRLLSSTSPEIRVQAAVSSLTHERQLYVLAPLSAYCSQPALAHAVLVVQLGFAPLDALLARAGSPMLLLSPQGVVFAATRPEWVYAVAPPLTQQRIDAIAALGQFGHHFDNGVASALPFSPTATKVMVDGQPHAVQQHAMDWRDPDGLWQLVMLDDISQWISPSDHLGYGVAAGLLLALLGLLALALLRSRAQMAATLERVQVLGTALEHSPLAVVVTDASGVIEWVNTQFERNTGYALHEVRGRKPSMLASGCTPAQTYHDMWSAVMAGRVWTGQFINRHRDGNPYQNDATISPVLNAQGQCVALVGLQQNVNHCSHTTMPLDAATVQLPSAPAPAAANPSATALPVQTGPLPPALHGARVLLAEDDPISQQVACALLEETGVQVDVAENGQAALNLLQQQPYDLVLMDMQMPLLDGLDATQRLRANPRFATLPIIAMTANASDTDRQRCLQAGMNEHLSKPIAPERLWQLLQHWLTPRVSANAIAPVPTRPDAAQNAELPPPIAGLDMALGLRYALGRQALYADLLRRFVRDQSGTASTLAACLTRHDRDTARRMAHSLRGLAATLGANALSATAAQLEQALENQAAHTPTLLHHLSAQLQALLDPLRQWQASQPVAPSLASDATEVGDNASQVLPSLYALLDQDDPAALAYLERHANHLAQAMGSDGPALAHAVRQFDFSTAQALLEKQMRPAQTLEQGAQPDHTPVTAPAH